MKKLLFILVAAIFTMAIFTTVAFASSEIINSESQNSEILDTGTEEDLTGCEEEDSLFCDIYRIIMNYSAEIVSLLSLLASLILTFLYRRGIIPTLDETIEKVKDEKEETALEKIYGEAARAIANLEEKLAPVTDAVRALLEECEADGEEGFDPERAAKILEKLLGIKAALEKANFKEINHVCEAPKG